MELVEVYSALGQERCVRLVQMISIGALRTFGVYQAIKVRSRLHTLSRGKLRAAAPKLWLRITQGDNSLARDLSQGILVSNIPFVVSVLDFLEIEHDGSGFFSKEADHTEHLSPGWPETVYEKFRGNFPEELILLYISHLGWETGTLERPFVVSEAETPASPAEE